MASYKESGVDVEEGYRAVNKYKEHAKRTAIPGLLTGLGSFNGMFEVPKGMKNPVIVSGTDGVGTKLDIAFKMKKYDTVGIDCVAMSVNDILCSGVQTLFFLDYVACGKLESDVAADLVKGVADGCVDTGCALLGGETAEMPDFYDDGKYSDCFYLEVVGDSMKDKRILPGDLIYVHKQSYLENGDIGVILLDNNEATVKQVFFRNDKMILQPANDNYQPLVLDHNEQKERNVQIIGKVLHNRIKF